jgi:hypothetical protein
MVFDEAEYRIRLVEEGFLNFAKWIVALSTGAIVLSFSFLKEWGAALQYKPLLILSWIFLLLSIICGIKYTKFFLNSNTYRVNYLQIKALHNERQDEEGKKVLSEEEKKYKKATVYTERLYNALEILFIFGITLFAIFAILNLYT